ncbi:16717_t:CDS:2, partial [Dentiscutata erythropus]
KKSADQQSVSNYSEASNRSLTSSSGSSSEEMCLHVAMEIRELGGNIKKVTVQRFYERNIKKKDGYISTLYAIGL